jgi:hypothetical protein
MPLMHNGSHGDYVEFKVQTKVGPVPVNARLIGSTNINWIGWPKTGQQPLMFVCFRDGSIYVYFGVSRQKAVAAAHATSSGQYLNSEIKPRYGAYRVR